MVTGDRTRHRLPREQALPLTVGEVMLARPKTFRSDIDVGEARRALQQYGQRLVLLVDGQTFRGAIDRAALDPNAPDSAPAATFASRDVATVTPATPVADARLRHPPPAGVTKLARGS